MTLNEKIEQYQNGRFPLTPLRDDIASPPTATSVRATTLSQTTKLESASVLCWKKFRKY